MTDSKFAWVCSSILGMTISGIGRARMLALFVVMIATSNLAIAHPNHAVEVVSADSPLHTVIQPSHAIVWATLVIGLWVLIQFRRRLLHGRLLRQRAG